jgi:hypothetical protein
MARRAKAGPAGRQVRRPAYRAAATLRPRPAASVPGMSAAKPGPGAARTRPHADATTGGRMAPQAREPSAGVPLFRDPSRLKGREGNGQLTSELAKIRYSRSMTRLSE